ncbi:zinc dependent phospholipase C family protein [Ectobacillus ponti]|uniref:Zinc dependent phospholipase C family protein n=1 Tax=Ectobacillus ponti TaxID=2961894 RepID=A0AA42BSJ1_9BACI|nr:zinc dependent phospholipase C family protein [Ectobacillus ponti]MCP8970599.1 zinc dependent phospholipase C family protein [Ectobacillus ponti]
MGSRIMHLIIARHIANRFPTADRNAFLLGGIAPDAVSPKNLSHFYSGAETDYSRSIAYGQFARKYSHYRNHPFILGYCTHLIADDIWLKGFYLPWLKNRMEADPGIFERYHADFRLLNAKLLQHYGCKKELMKDLRCAGEMVELEEVTAEDVGRLLPYVQKDMEFDEEDLRKPLRVFTLEQIIGYIETAADQGFMYLQSKGLC